jgi:hypothetical protein
VPSPAPAADNSGAARPGDTRARGQHVAIARNKMVRVRHQPGPLGPRSANHRPSSGEPPSGARARVLPPPVLFAGTNGVVRERERRIELGEVAGSISNSYCRLGLSARDGDTGSADESRPSTASAAAWVMVQGRRPGLIRSGSSRVHRRRVLLGLGPRGLARRVGRVSGVHARVLGTFTLLPARSGRAQ